MTALGPRPRLLPIAPHPAPARRALPVIGETRPVDERWRPNYAVWEITLACDLACRHCGSRAGRARPDELTTEECLDLVDQMADLGVKEVTMIGGEAYLREDWLDIARHVRKRGMICTVTTGGRGLTRDRVFAAKEAGIQAFSVSVDGLRESHDALRAAQGSHEAALAALSYIKESGLRSSVNTQINRPNIREIPEAFAMLLDLGIKAWQVQITTAMGRAGDEPEILLEPYQMIEVLPLVTRMKRLAQKRGVTVWPGNNIGYFGPNEDELRGNWPGGHRGSCGAGRRTLGIEANGDIKGCPSLPSSDYVGGNVRDAKLRAIWEGTKELRFMRDHKKEELSGFCATCYYADECKGGCQWTSHVLRGFRGDNPYCHHRTIELLQRGVRERIRKVVAAPGEPFDYSRFETFEEPWPEDERKMAEAIVATNEGWLPISAPSAPRSSSAA